jgi:tetratricopeptide (TPR) repeat protein
VPRLQAFAAVKTGGIDFMRVRLFFLLLVTVLACYGAAPETGAKKLREVVRLPTINFAFSLVFQRGNGWTLNVVGAEEDYSAEIATLRKELRGDASDAERFTRLVTLYAKANDKTNSAAAAGKALERWRQRVELQPDKGPLLTQFGESLSGAEKYEEAESVLRKAARIAPAEWKCWIALGCFLDGKAQRALGSDSLQTGEKLFASIFEKPPAAHQVKEAEKLLDEADECFNKAATTAPKEAETFFERAVHRSMRNAYRSVFRILRGETTDRTDIFRAFFTPDCIPDFREVVRLSPKDYLAIGGCAFFEAWSQALQKRATVQSGEDLWNLLPDETRQSILSLFARLEHLSESPDPRLAAGAFTSLAVARSFVRGDFPGAITNLRRALALVPSSDMTMDLLVSLHASEARFDELLPLCEQNLKRKDTIRNRIVLAKVYDKLNETQQAEEQVRTILKREPDNILANLALASLLLKRGQDESVLREIEVVLRRTGPLFEKTDTSDIRDLQVHYVLTVAVFYGLSARNEDARAEVRKVLSQDPDSDYAKAVLAALGLQ